MICDNEQSLITISLGNQPAKQALENFREAARVATTQDALSKLLACFNKYCAENEIAYFLFSDSLQGAIAYEDFIPGKTNIQLGMLYSEYKKLHTFSNGCDFEISSEPFPCKISFWQDNARIQRRYPRIQATIDIPVRFEGEDVFDENSLPIEIESPYIEISIFTATPDNLFTKKSFFRRMRRRNLLYDRINKAHNAIAHRKSSIIGPDGFFALIPRKLIVSMIFRCASAYEGRGMESVTRVFGTRSKTIPIDALGSYRQIVFHGVKTWGPEHRTAWATEPIIETPLALKSLQQCALEIVSEIHRVCKILGIGYFVCGGTLLGYVRHGGFIPWDDDIDIGMLRADYETFMSKAPQILNSDRFFLQTRESDPNIPYLFSKIRMNGTTYITDYNQFREFHKGICVDIFPFDSIPNGRKSQELFKADVRKAEVRHNKVANHQYPKSLTDAHHKISSPLDCVGIIVGKLVTHFYWKHSLLETQTAYDKTVQQYNEVAEQEGYEYVACFVPSFTMVKKSNLLPYREVDFEGIRVNVPSHPEVFLRMQYGDFEEMPLPHQRVGHDLLEWSNEIEAHEDQK